MIARVVEKSSSGTHLRSGARRFSVVEFLIALVVMLVFAPFIELLPHGHLVDLVLFTLVLLSAVLAIGASRSTFLWAIGLVVPALWGDGGRISGRPN